MLTQTGEVIIDKVTLTLTEIKSSYLKGSYSCRLSVEVTQNAVRNCIYLTTLYEHEF